MMATGSTSDLPQSNEPVTATAEEPAADAPKAAVNDADLKRPNDKADASAAPSANVSVYGGSDAELSKSDAPKTKDGSSLSSSAVKKATSFKSVSVNKTFLAGSKGSPTAAPAKLADKSSLSSSASTSQANSASATASRPRLVAKSAGLISKLSLGANGAKGGVPDPNAVWNKNRPAPPTEPPKFTDEELMNHGIHIASHLGTNESNNQGTNWADEDDDEEWKLEVIQWGDGTTTRIPKPQEKPAKADKVQTTDVKSDGMASRTSSNTAKENGEQPKSSAASSIASSSTKPAAGLPSGKGLVLKGGATEKGPTLVAKPPAPPVPAKSPWAPLPKMAKPSPFLTDATPAPTPTAKHAPSGVRDSLGLPKEIGPDDFSRSWRDSPGSVNRELFNSQSGRYEPVSDRRGPFRTDSYRQPSLLQRMPPGGGGGSGDHTAWSASGGGDHHQHVPPPYGYAGPQRRRGSSNVSGGSGSFLSIARSGKHHEISMPPLELLGARTGPATGTGPAASGDSPVSPRRPFSPHHSAAPLRRHQNPPHHHHHPHPIWQSHSQNNNPNSQSQPPPPQLLKDHENSSQPLQTPQTQPIPPPQNHPHHSQPIQSQPHSSQQPQFHQGRQNQQLYQVQHHPRSLANAAANPPTGHSPSRPANSAATNSTSNASLSLPTSHVLATPIEQELEEQKRLMRERVELARKRREEEEAREEAARKERLRIKLEALGPPPERNSEKKAAAAAAAVESAKAAAATAAAATAATAKITATASSTTDTTQSQVTGARPSTNNTPLTRTDAQTSESVPPPPLDTQVNQTAPGSIVPPPANKSMDLVSPPPPAPGGVMNDKGAPSHAHPWSAPSSTSQNPQQHQHQHQHQQQQQQQQHDRFSQWGPLMHSSALRNVWGSPNNSDRSLGNGTFTSDVGCLPDASTSLAQAGNVPRPGPIAPPSVRGGSRRPPNMVERTQPPIAPPAQAAVQRNAWANAVRSNDDFLNHALNQSRAKERSQLAAQGKTLNDVQPVIEDSWRPTTVSADGMRQEGAQQKITHGPQQAKNAWAPAPSSADGENKTVPLATQLPSSSGPDAGPLPPPKPTPAPTTTTSTVGTSRFFPSAHTQSPSKPAAEGSAARLSRSPSPPPPDMAGHPVFDGDALRPQVSLPRPQPIVRLPPSGETRASPRPMTIGAATVRSGDSPIGSPSVSSRVPAVRSGTVSKRQSVSSAWQSRIDRLLGGGGSENPSSSPPPPPISKLLSPRVVPSTTGLPSADSPIVESKPMAEECFEEQEMGSLPLIKIPTEVPLCAWPPYPPPKLLPKQLRPVVESVVAPKPGLFTMDMTGSGNAVKIQFPGMTEAKVVTIPFSRTRSNPRRTGRGGSSCRNASDFHRTSGGPRDRESSGAYDGEHGGPSLSLGIHRRQGHRSRGGGGGGGGGSYNRPREDNWPRHRQTSLQA